MLLRTGAILSSIYALAMAAPQNATSTDVNVSVQFWSGDLCNGQMDSVDLVGSSAYRCVAVTNKRSISASINE